MKAPEGLKGYAIYETTLKAMRDTGIIRDTNADASTPTLNGSLQEL